MVLHDEERDPSPETEPSPPPQLELATPPTEREAPPATRAGAIDARIVAFAGDLRLSSRERTVLRLIVQGYRYREIGCVMSISPRTVKMYATNLMRKFGGHSRWDLTRRVLAE